MNFSNFYHSTKSTLALRRYFSLVEKINALEPALQGVARSELQARARALRDASEARLVSLFALIREASRQTLGLRQHNVQLVGGLVLYHGKLAEMQTGEGKTLTIAAPCIAAALEGRPVHVVTVNEYLAQRDAESLRPLYEVFGLSVGVLKAGQSVAEKQAAYACDIVYGVNHEFGFDYLRDNMVHDATQRVQRGLGFAVVDEVDSILIDEARTPLIISGQASDGMGYERAADDAVQQLVRGTHYIVDEKERLATLTDEGYSALEQLVSAQGLLADPKALYKVENLPLLQHVGQALLARSLYRRDKHYVVQGGEVVIVDESTGRLMPGRRWGEGLHEAVEAKEGLTVKPRTVTQATITYQNFFGLYERLSGLTGTAATEAEEFAEIYGLETVVVPPNKPSARQDHPDVVFPTRQDKFAAIVREVQHRHAKGQPVLVGTASVADSERISRLLTEAGVYHAVLNARQNAQEADVIARAGLLGAVTVATNMAGRGTDILLGGKTLDGEDPQAQASRRAAVVAVGGLHVIGTERHDSRRVDNQLRGRAGRQGDVGSSQFFISLEDRLLRVFASDKHSALSGLASAAAGSSHAVLDKVVRLAQRRMEEQGFQARRELLKYDSVLASQRLALYAVRDDLLQADGAQLVAHAAELAGLAAVRVANEWLDSEWLPEDFDALAFKNALAQTFGVSAPVVGWVHQEELEPKEMRARARELVAAHFKTLSEGMPPAALRSLLLLALDRQWVEHLTSLDELRAAIGLRAMAQQNPVFAFALEAKRLFEALSPAWAFAATQLVKEQANFTAAMQGTSEAASELTPAQKVALAQVQRFVTRNEACPCGSGKRFKFCHGSL